MFSEIRQIKKNFSDLKKYFKSSRVFPARKNEIRVSLFSMVFCDTTYLFAGLVLVQSQFS